MSNKTLIPAFQCKVGDWNYYSCTMKYGEVARQVKFAYEMGGNKELGQLIQRGITSRTQGITDYLLASNHRFLGGLVVAAWGGEPNYTPLTMADPDGMLSGLDNGFGVLTFDGTQDYFVLDGQHRLKAIKDAIKMDKELLKEDICVLIVTHYDTAQGRIRTRRLFSNINRNAKKTDAAEDIALDEDDAFAVLTRRLLDEHPFLKQDRRVRVILPSTEDGVVKLAGNSIPNSDSRALTSITVVYDILQHLAFDQPASIRNRTSRPADEILEEVYKVLLKRFDDLLLHCGSVRTRLESATSARELRSPKNAEGNGHAFMRPVVQKSVARVISASVQQELATWDELMSRLDDLSWALQDAPWSSVWAESEPIAAKPGQKGKMLVGKDNTVLLGRLLQAHLAPTSLAEIKRATTAYREIRGVKYPVSNDILAKRLVPGGSGGVSKQPIVDVVELSNSIVTLGGQVNSYDTSDSTDDLADDESQEDEALNDEVE